MNLEKKESNNQPEEEIKEEKEIGSRMGRLEALRKLEEMEQTRAGQKTVRFQGYAREAEIETEELEEIAQLAKMPESKRFSLIEWLNNYRKQIIMPAILGTMVDIGSAIAQSTETEKFGTVPIKPEGQNVQIMDKAGESAKNHWLEKIKEDPFRSFPSLVDDLDEPWAQEVITKTIQSDPAVILATIDPGMRALSRYKKLRREIKETLEHDKALFAKSILSISESSLTKEQKITIAPLLDQLSRGELSIDEAVKLGQDHGAMLKSLIEIKSKLDHLADASVERSLREVSLETINKINDLHDEANQDIRFASVKEATPETVYTLMVYGDQETYTSTFNGLFNRLTSNPNFSTNVLNNVNYNHFRTFIKLCSQYNRLDDLFAKIPDAKVSLLESFSKNLEKEKDSIEQAVAVADAISGIKDQETIKILKENIKSEYLRLEKSGEKRGSNIYGLLASLVGSKNDSSETDPWFKEIQERYKIANLDNIDKKDLVNPDGRVVEQMFFYNDEDGVGTFEIFLKKYGSDQKHWEIQEENGYVKITSKDTKNKLVIFANRPTKEKEGVKDIEVEVNKEGLKVNVVVHRGHSTHVEDTIDRMPETAKIVALGACGGYKYLQKVLKVLPEAHIISTKGKGAVVVNEPLLNMLNNEVADQDGLNWDHFWEKVSVKLGKIEEFPNYVAPNRNLGVKMLMAIKNLEAKNK